jgi:hypothetical protein
MSIKLNIEDEQKNHLSNLLTEIQVLNNLLIERKMTMDSKVKEALEANGLSPNLYVMRLSPKDGIWEAQLKPGILAIPKPGAKN